MASFRGDGSERSPIILNHHHDDHRQSGDTSNAFSAGQPAGQPGSTAQDGRLMTDNSQTTAATRGHESENLRPENAHVFLDPTTAPFLAATPAMPVAPVAPIALAAPAVPAAPLAFPTPIAPAPLLGRSSVAGRPRPSAAGRSTRARPRRRPSPPLPPPPPASTFQRNAAPIGPPARRRSPPLPPPPPASTFRRNTIHVPMAPAASTPSTPVSGTSSASSTRGPSRSSAAQRTEPPVVLPRWQPDAEVTYCPICNRQFSIFVRKHHCRKCGRVVCNSCSPHRITIPYQYIVQPPGMPPFGNGVAAAGALLDGSGGDMGGMLAEDVASLGGGERVRLCNPCVPDPNTAPPRTHGYLVAPTPPGSGGHLPFLSMAPAYPTAPRYHNPYRPPAPGPASPEARVTASSLPSSVATQLASPAAFANLQMLLGIGAGAEPPSGSSRRASVNPTNPMLRTSGANTPISPVDAIMLAAEQQRNQSRMPATVAPPPPPRRQIPEEDECPVCHFELPSRRLPDFEKLREDHITKCIEDHSLSNSRSRTNRSSRSRSSAGDPSSSSAAGSSSMLDPLPPPPPRRSGMFPYTATEKDCVDSAECTICLEEFEVGVPMGRLECLCRFHRSCIEAWFENHPGRCPVHQHDSFGY